MFGLTHLNNELRRGYCAVQSLLERGKVEEAKQLLFRLKAEADKVVLYTAPAPRLNGFFSQVKWFFKNRKLLRYSSIPGPNDLIAQNIANLLGDTTC